MAGEITALKVQERDKTRVSVYLNGEYAFGLALIHALWLKTGQTLTDVQIDELKAADTLEKAKQRAVDFIVYRPRTEREVRRRLAKAGVDESVIEGIVVDLRSAGLLDDAAFSQQWVESRLRSSPRSRRMMEWELRQKGVDRGLIEKVLDTAEVDDVQSATEAARRRLPRLAHVDALTRKRKLSDFLARNGYSYDIIRDVLTALLDEAGVEEHHGRDNSGSD